ncbi:TPA: hypothetical protein JLP44_004584 [Escherichia coli]|nr:hypothetical protein [Escherichia coli]HAW2379027.1 hypothetical protein [Escherichia coli]
MPTEYARDNLGRYQTDGLSAKDFNKVFDLIRKQQRQNRRNARRTLTPRIMGMRNRELEAFLSLGKKKDGTYFTPEDIRSFNTSRQAHKTKFKSTVKASRVREAQARAEADALKKALQTQANNLIKFFMSQGMDKAAATAQARSILETQINEARKRKG